MREQVLESLFLQESQPHGTLTVWESCRHVPFQVLRVFTVVANDGGLRGQHAHRQCQQAIFCVAGSVSLLCDDGHNKRHYDLIPNGRGILVPQGVWAEQRYLEDKTMILVLCDQPYEEADYIRNYEEFQLWKREGN